MKIDHLLESKVLLEGGNLSINGHEAQHLDLKVTNRSYMVPKLNNLLNAINNAYAKIFKEPLWSPELLASGEFLSGSSLHFFNVKGIDDETFVAKKPTVGDIDTMVDKEKELNLQDFLNGYQNKKIGPATLLGFQRGNEQFSALFEMKDPPVKIQIDFEFVKFDKGRPTDWARFSHSSAWEDLQAGVKGVFHKWLIQAFTSLTRREFYLRKMVGRGKLRKEEDVLTTDNMFSFAVSSKEGGGLRAKYEPVMDGNKPLMKDGLPVMTAAPTSGYEQDIGQIFSKILGEKLTPQEAKALANNFWSFTGLLQVMNKLMSPEEKQQVLTGFLDKTIGPGAQGMYKNNPDKDISEKTTAINTLLQTLNLKAPSNLKQMLSDYRKAYKMTGTDEGVEARKDTVKTMAKRTLDEAAPNYKRQGIQHIYNPGSTVEMKDLDFINFCKEIMQDGGKFQGVPINLKVDGAGIRFGKDEQGRPFFMTSRVTEPKYLDNYGDFEAYGRSQGQSEERLNFTKNYDEALKTILTADFMKDIPPDTIVQAEMLYNPMAKQTDDGLEFVNIPYDPSKLGTEMTLVPISVKEYSTGQTRPDAAKIKKQLIKDSTDEVKLINNTLNHKGINVSNIIAPIVKNEEALTQALQTRGTSPAKEKAKSVLSKARQALSKAIINGPIEGKDQLGDTIEGLVINMPSGTLAKVTSPDMQNKMAAKQLANKKPTTGSKRVKPAVVTIGSFVGHKGHQQLIQQTIDTAQSVGGDPYIFVSPVMGPDDPIPAADKVKTLQALYPQYANNIQVWNPQGTPMKKIEKELVLPTDSPYNKVMLLVGDDRYESMKNWMDSLEKRMKDPAAIAKYGGTQNQVDFETIRTERDPSKGGTGISFTQLRNKLKDPNASEQDKLNYWMQAFDGETLGQEWIKHLMDVTAKNMGIQQQAIKEYIQKIKPMLETATPAQKQKIYQQLSRLKQQTIVEAENKKCPPATQDISLNLENRQKAIDEYGYGPLNPDLPNTKFWMIKVQEWNLDSMEEAKQSLCGNCAAFDIRKETLDCIAKGIDSDNPSDAEGTIDAGELGYCKFLKFKCASRRTCDAWVTGGPLTDQENIKESLLDYTNRQRIIQYLAKKMDWEVSYLELATDHELIKWYKKVRAGQDPMREQQLDEFAPDEGGGSRKFIPWNEFVDQLKQILHKDFDCKENIVKSTIKARFVPHDPMEYGPTMLYSYYETRAGGRMKGAISTRGSIQIGKYTRGGLFGQSPDQLLTGFHLLKGHPFERHFDLTFDNIYKIANIIQGNTEGALEFQPQQGMTEAEIERKEGFRGRVTPDVEYIVRDNNGNIVRVCKTKKEAKLWADMVTLSKEEMWAKYPQLRVDESENDLLNPTDPETQQILKYAQRHYPDAPNAQQAFMKYVLHALNHSENDDKRQDNDISDLKNAVNDLSHEHMEIKGAINDLHNMSESIDYLDEK